MRSIGLCLAAAAAQLAGAATVTGEGVDCARLLQPDQRVEVVTGFADTARAAL